MNAAILAALTAGICLGFLPHNFNPAKTFMGDSGANLLGLLLAAAAVQGLLKTTAILALLLLPLVLLAVPILDTGIVVARRIKNRTPFYRADREHFHHRLADIGFSQRRTVLYLYAWTVTLAAFSLALRAGALPRGQRDPARLAGRADRCSEPWRPRRRSTSSGC